MASDSSCRTSSIPLREINANRSANSALQVPRRVRLAEVDLVEDSRGALSAQDPADTPGAIADTQCSTQFRGDGSRILVPRDEDERARTVNRLLAGNP